ncbi:DUF2946 domain-containing protein [Pinirhizobacter soli]|uniref:DUF2946 domain-containing protein n=1 Tax=Pinirhizobacter soli TaxID=2786953 RepID=UPI00202A38C6|nr:DUF2946 domain-containing protein [Pinirhizobacter soli]
MFKRHLHRRIAAWLALLAVGLMVAAPGISQVLRSRASFAELGAWCEGRAGLVTRAAPVADASGTTASSTHSAMAGMGDMSMDACGYCSLFCHAPTVPATVAFMPMLVPATTAIPAEVPASPLPMAPRTPVAEPRGPPVFSMT